MIQSDYDFQTGIDMPATGEHITELFDTHGWTTKDVADMLNISPEAVRKWKKGKSLPEPNNWYILSRMMEIKMEDFIVPISRVNKNAEADDSASVFRYMEIYNLPIGMYGFKENLSFRVE